MRAVARAWLALLVSPLCAQPPALMRLAARTEHGLYVEHGSDRRQSAAQDRHSGVHLAPREARSALGSLGGTAVGGRVAIALTPQVGRVARNQHVGGVAARVGGARRRVRLSARKGADLSGRVPCGQLR